MKETIVFLLSFSFQLPYRLEQNLSKIFSTFASHHALHQLAKKKVKNRHSNLPISLMSFK